MNLTGVDEHSVGILLNIHETCKFQVICICWSFNLYKKNI